MYKAKKAQDTTDLSSGSESYKIKRTPKKNSKFSSDDDSGTDDDTMAYPKPPKKKNKSVSTYLKISFIIQHLEVFIAVFACFLFCFLLRPYYIKKFQQFIVQ